MLVIGIIGFFVVLTIVIIIIAESRMDPEQKRIWRGGDPYRDLPPLEREEKRKKRRMEWIRFFIILIVGFWLLSRFLEAIGL